MHKILKLDLVIANWNVCLNWVGIIKSIILNQIVSWKAGLLELTMIDQADPVLQIASVQAQITSAFSQNMDRDENYDVMNTGVFLPVRYIFTSNLLCHGTFYHFESEDT